MQRDWKITKRKRIISRQINKRREIDKNLLYILVLSNLQSSLKSKSRIKRIAPNPLSHTFKQLSVPMHFPCIYTRAYFFPLSHHPSSLTFHMPQRILVYVTLSHLYTWSPQQSSTSMKHSLPSFVFPFFLFRSPFLIHFSSTTTPFRCSFSRCIPPLSGIPVCPRNLNGENPLTPPVGRTLLLFLRFLKYFSFFFFYLFLSSFFLATISSDDDSNVLFSNYYPPFRLTKQ